MRGDDAECAAQRGMHLLLSLPVLLCAWARRGRPWAAAARLFVRAGPMTKHTPAAVETANTCPAARPRRTHRLRRSPLPPRSGRLSFHSSCASRASASSGRPRPIC